MSDKHDTDTGKPKFINANRRGFLQGAALATGVAATGAAAAVESVNAPAIESPAPEGAKGYRLTEHVKKYYQRARF